MLTQNYYNYLANAIACEGYVPYLNDRKRALPLRTTRNVTIYHTLGYESSTSGFPVANKPNVVYNSSHAPGIAVGFGDTPPALDDINLEHPIVSGISMTLISTKRGTDSLEDPYMEFFFSVTNTSVDPITIREVGIRQEYYGYYDGINPSSWLMDRTVLEEPITIQPEEAGTIKYRVKTTTPEVYKNGIKLVSFCYGSDEDVAAMIDAAHQGLIDLQADGHWHVGDTRSVHVSAWTGGSNVQQAAADRRIMISNFGDYNNCGSIMQFDFYDVSSEQQKIDTSYNFRYGTTEMCTTTLPAYANALPSWLKDRLLTFDVIAATNNSHTVETVSGNKLALRSIVEYTGDSAYANEGSIVDAYKYGANYYYNSWTRSPAGGNSYYKYVDGNSSGGTYPTSVKYIRPFGCL